MKKGSEIQTWKEIVIFLEKSAKANGAPIWRVTARHLAKARRRRVRVGLSRISKLANGKVVLVPGKLLGGELEKPVTIAAMAATASVRKQIQKAGAKLISIHDMVKLYPKGTGVQLVI